MEINTATFFCIKRFDRNHGARYFSHTLTNSHGRTIDWVWDFYPTWDIGYNTKQQAEDTIKYCGLYGCKVVEVTVTEKEA